MNQKGSKNIIIQITSNHMSNNSKRGWLPEEDQFLLQLIATASSEKLKWVEVAKELQEKTGRIRTGKQCRERWQHQLNPAIVRDEWTDAEQMRLFQLQAEFGNKWAQIAQNLPGRTDNAVKNFFYSAVRRVFTKVNMYLNKQRNLKEFKSIRQFQTDFLSKLMAVVDGNYSKKIRLTNDDAINTAREVLANVAVLSINHDNYQDSQHEESKFKELIKIMHDFRKSCKKRKQKRNQFDKQDFIESEEEQSSSKSIRQMNSSSEHSSRSDRSTKKHIAEQILQKSEMKDEKEQMHVDFLNQLKVLTKKEISGEDINTSGSIDLTEANQIFSRPEPSLFKIFSGSQDRRNDKWWEVLNVNSGVVNSFRMEEESLDNWEWKQDEIFSLGNHREDFLGTSQAFDSSQIVTKFKMLEASIALEDLLLNSRKSSRFEQYPQFS